MRVLEASPPSLTRHHHIVALFGEGLIGSSCRDWLRQLQSWREKVLPFGWGDSSRSDDSLIRDALINTLSASSDHLHADFRPRRLTFLWSAGRCGFGASDSETEPELRDFGRVLQIALAVKEAAPHVSVDFVMFSSAGGLFEGERLISHETLPHPVRPYGHLKLAQEQMLLAAAHQINTYILRPSSVFGPVTPAGRMGLIPVFIRNGIRRAVSTVAGTLSTERDYVYVHDIGLYIASKLLYSDPFSQHPVEFLVSGRPTTILEISRLIEQALGRKLYVHFNASPDNSRDITFAPNVVPPQPWRTSDLATTIRMICRQYISAANIPSTL